jgi:hypothetical protein
MTLPFFRHPLAQTLPYTRGPHRESMPAQTAATQFFTGLFLCRSFSRSSGFLSTFSLLGPSLFNPPCLYRNRDCHARHGRSSSTRKLSTPPIRPRTPPQIRPQRRLDAASLVIRGVDSLRSHVPLLATSDRGRPSRLSPARSRARVRPTGKPPMEPHWNAVGRQPRHGCTADTPSTR